MSKKSLTLVAIIFSFFSFGCAAKDSPIDFKFIDDYLVAWDQFAKGQNDLMPQLKTNKHEFSHQLATALNQGDKRAPSRLVFYAVVQVGGFIPYESELGKACEKVVGKEVTVFESKKGERSYFAGDLFFWWEKKQGDFERFPLYDEWRQRDFVKKSVIRLYESATKQRP